MTTARSVPEAKTAIGENRFDAIVLDLNMKDGGGLAVLAELRRRGMAVPTILLTVEIQPSETVEALRLGCNGIILKDAEPGEILDLIHKVIAGDALEELISALITEHQAAQLAAMEGIS